MKSILVGTCLLLFAAGYVFSQIFYPPDTTSPSPSTGLSIPSDTYISYDSTVDGPCYEDPQIKAIKNLITAYEEGDLVAKAWAWVKLRREVPYVRGHIVYSVSIYGCGSEPLEFNRY
jgi:hypothetical protein